LHARQRGLGELGFNGTSPSGKSGLGVFDVVNNGVFQCENDEFVEIVVNESAEIVGEDDVQKFVCYASNATFAVRIDCDLDLVGWLAFPSDAG
jgi:hypothetical protein